MRTRTRREGVLETDTVEAVEAERSPKPEKAVSSLSQREDGTRRAV